MSGTDGTALPAQQSNRKRAQSDERRRRLAQVSRSPVIFAPDGRLDDGFGGSAAASQLRQPHPSHVLTGVITRQNRSTESWFDHRLNESFATHSGG
jgi:hypothetical protein